MSRVMGMKNRKVTDSKNTRSKNGFVRTINVSDVLFFSFFSTITQDQSNTLKFCFRSTKRNARHPNYPRSHTASHSFPVRISKSTTGLRSND